MKGKGHPIQVLPPLWQQFGEHLHIGVMVRRSHTFGHIVCLQPLSLHLSPLWLSSVVLCPQILLTAVQKFLIKVLLAASWLIS